MLREPRGDRGCLGRSKPGEWAASPQGACSSTVKECRLEDRTTCLFISLANYQLSIIAKGSAQVYMLGCVRVSMHGVGADGTSNVIPLNGQTSEMWAM